MPQSLSPAVKVVVFQCPCGMEARHLSPRLDRPRRRAILVDAAVSSMKISRAGSRSSWPSNQSRRRRRTSARCCSLACAVFFERDAALFEEHPHRRRHHPNVMLGRQPVRDLGQRDVRRLGNKAEDEALMRIELRARRLALLARRHLAARPITTAPPERHAQLPAARRSRPA